MAKQQQNTAKNILVSCGGKWVGLVQQLRLACSESPDFRKASIFVADQDRFAPAVTFADKWLDSPPITSEDYVTNILTACKTNAIKLVIPLIDVDVNRLAPAVPLFTNSGIHLACPPEPLAKLCFDKNAFDTFCKQHSLPTPKRYNTPEQAQQGSFPLFAKPFSGYGSQDLLLLKSEDDVARKPNLFKTHLVQEYIDAEEVSVDAYIANDGNCICRVPRIRIRVVGGEVYASRTIDYNATSRIADLTLSALAKEGLRGPVNIQLFNCHKPLLIEVNPRLGSGNVLSNMASHGALYRALLTEAAGDIAAGDPNNYVRNLSLRRYHGDVFHLPDRTILAQSDLNADFLQ